LNITKPLQRLEYSKILAKKKWAEDTRSLKGVYEEEST
jgi:hypothetical protein